MRKSVVLLAVLTLLLVTSAALAYLTDVGPLVEGGSWSQAFNESGVGPFDFMAVKMTSAGDTFEHWTFNSFSQGTWSTAGVDENASPYPTLATATGTADVTNMNFNIRFAGVSSNPLEFDFVAFHEETLLETAHIKWTGGGWVITAGSWRPTRAALVPVPAAVLLGMLGMGVAGMKLRKFV